MSENAPYAVAADEERCYYTTMFHPEAVQTPDGAKLIANFLLTAPQLELGSARKVYGVTSKPRR